MTRKRDRGFTLLEILVALVVMGLLFAALAEGSRLGLRAWDMQTRMIDNRDELDAIDRTLRQLVEQADAGTPAGGPTLFGSTSRLVITSRLPSAALSTRVADIILGVDGAHQLEIRWTPHLHVIRIGPPARIQETILLRGVARVEISFLRQDGVGGWQKNWSARELPGLIRFRIVFADGDPRRWPDIVAAPMNGH